MTLWDQFPRGAPYTMGPSTGAAVLGRGVWPGLGSPVWRAEGTQGLLPLWAG